MLSAIGKLFGGLFGSKPKPKEYIVKISVANQEGVYETMKLREKLKVEKKKYDFKMKKKREKEAAKQAKIQAKLAAKKAKEDRKKAA